MDTDTTPHPYTPQFPPPSVERRNVTQVNRLTEESRIARFLYLIQDDPIEFRTWIDAQDTLAMYRDLAFRKN